MAKRVGELKDVDKANLENHNYNAMTAYLERIALKYPKITYLYSVGKSVQKRDLWVMAISDNPKQHELLEPELKLVGNMHGNEVAFSLSLEKQVFRLWVVKLCYFSLNCSARIMEKMAL